MTDTTQMIGVTLSPPVVRGTLKPVLMPFIAKDKVRFVGEIIAVVVAPNHYIAEDIVDLIQVDYASLPAYTDVEEAMQDGAVLLHEDLGGNVYYRDTFANDNVEQAFREADLVLKEKVCTGRTSAAPIEDVIVLEANAADLTIDDGQIHVIGSPGRGISVAEIAHITYFDRLRRPPEDEIEPTLTATRHYDPPAAYANGSHAVIIELDPALGTIDIKRIVAVEDCGTMIYPKIVEGQMRGGVAQGIGMGLLESLDYDRNGQLRNASFMDFLIPNAMILPDIECAHIVTPSPYTEGGFKGAGEAAMLSIHSALANAVSDGLSDYGVLVPMVTPMGPQQIMDLMKRAAAAA